jgi:hypothetical protein
MEDVNGNKTEHENKLESERGSGQENEHENEEMLILLTGNNLTVSEREGLKSLELSIKNDVKRAVRQLIAVRKSKKSGIMV